MRAPSRTLSLLPLGLVAGVLLLGAGVANAQTASMSVTSGTGAIGSAVDVSVLATHSHEADGFSLGILHRNADVTINTVDIGAAIVALQGIDPTVPAFMDVNLTPALPALTPAATGGFTIGLILDFTTGPLVRLPLGTDQEVLVIQYAIAPTAVAGTVDLEFNGSRGSPPVQILMVLSVPTADPAIFDPVEVTPTTTNGTLTIANSPFLRGDVNDSGHLSLVDGILLLYRMFGLQPAGTCLDAEDINDDGAISLQDPITLFTYLYGSGPMPAAPFPLCGDDGTPANSLGCTDSLFCP